MTDASADMRERSQPYVSSRIPPRETLRRVLKDHQHGRYARFSLTFRVESFPRKSGFKCERSLRTPRQRNE